MSVSVILRCAGCASEVDPRDPAVDAFECPNSRRAPNVDHVLAWDPVTAGVGTWPNEGAINPFVRYRTLLHSYWLARAGGVNDDDFVGVIGRLDRSVAAVSGSGFVITPFDGHDDLSAATGAEVWVKDETGAVGGSHKARHLFGLALHLEVKRVPARAARLAIASCGNAALGAAVVARATRRPLDVFVPPSADPGILDELRLLGAQITPCPRRSDDPPGDPCLHRFREARRRGAVPFCCQGPENGLTIDGGRTLAYELVSQWGALGWVPDRVLIQVGGGALGSALATGLETAARLGALARLPVFHFVQSEGVAPLYRAWRRVAERVVQGGVESAGSLADAALADLVRRLADADPSVISANMQFALTHRPSFMWPWEDVHESIATGILDDETYDWGVLVHAMLRTGGWPLVVSERRLEDANAYLPHADHTGTAGVAGLLELHREGRLEQGERCVALATGRRR